MPISIWSKSNFEELLGIGITNRHGEHSFIHAKNSLSLCATLHDSNKEVDSKPNHGSRS